MNATNSLTTGFLRLGDVKTGVKEDAKGPALQRVVIMCTILMVLLGAGAWANAQRRVVTPPMDPMILSRGGNIGFRMVGRKGDTVVGSLVVRVNGEWIATEYVYGVKPVIK
jgi:hypothetical protein